MSKSLNNYNFATYESIYVNLALLYNNCTDEDMMELLKLTGVYNNESILNKIRLMLASDVVRGTDMYIKIHKGQKRIANKTYNIAYIDKESTHVKIRKNIDKIVILDNNKYDSIENSNIEENNNIDILIKPKEASLKASKYDINIVNNICGASKSLKYAIYRAIETGLIYVDNILDDILFLKQLRGEQNKKIKLLIETFKGNIEDIDIKVVRRRGNREIKYKLLTLEEDIDDLVSRVLLDTENRLKITINKIGIAKPAGEITEQDIKDAIIKTGQDKFKRGVAVSVEDDGSFRVLTSIRKTVVMTGKNHVEILVPEGALFEPYYLASRDYMGKTKSFNSVEVSLPENVVDVRNMYGLILDLLHKSRHAIIKQEGLYTGCLHINNCEKVTKHTDIKISDVLSLDMYSIKELKKMHKLKYVDNIHIIYK